MRRQAYQVAKRIESNRREQRGVASTRGATACWPRLADNSGLTDAPVRKALLARCASAAARHDHAE